jgi:hypothetical protein
MLSGRLFHVRVMSVKEPRLGWRAKLKRWCRSMNIQSWLSVHLETQAAAEPTEILRRSHFLRLRRLGKSLMP